MADFVYKQDNYLEDFVYDQDSTDEIYDLEGGLDNIVSDETRLSFVGMAVPEFAQKVLDQFRQRLDPQVLIALPPGHAIVDSGAGQDLIGKPAYDKLKEKLKERGPRPVELKEKSGAALGVGGKAKTLFLSLIPCVLGGAPGIVRITVVQQDIPHLLSIGLLESLGSIIDIKGNVLKYENYDSEDFMFRMSSGHRTIDVTKWDGGSFPVPQQVRDQYGLADGAFDFEDSARSDSEAYGAAAPGFGEQWNEGRLNCHVHASYFQEGSLCACRWGA